MAALCRLLLALFPVVLLALSACTRPPRTPAPAALQFPEPSRTPAPGCTWQPFIAPEQHFAMLVEACEPGVAPFSYSADDDGVLMKLAGAPVGRRIIEFYAKPAGAPVTEVLAERFIAPLAEPEHSGCEVRPTRRAPITAEKQAYVLAPNASYAPVVEARRRQEAGVVACSSRGVGDAVQYFEYHPQESTTRYLFVRLGQDAPPFDPASLRFLP